MTQADRDRRQARLSLASFIVSILALIASITGPLVAYYWLQGSLRLFELKRSAFLVRGLIETSPSNCDGGPTGPKGASYELRIENSGSLPIEKVRISVRGSRRVKGRKEPVDLDPKNIKVFPPIPIEVGRDRGILITFKDAIPPHSDISLQLTEFIELDKKATFESAAPWVWVYSEVSEEYILWSKDETWEYDCP
jgi:hypothetical protein